MGPLLRLCMLFPFLLNTSIGMTRDPTTLHPILAAEETKKDDKQTTVPDGKHKTNWTDSNTGETSELYGLLNDVRRYQLGVAVAQANHSHANDLGKFEAEADVAEAEQRRQEAHIKTVKAKSLFDSDKSMYNLGYIGRGYDIFRGHPMSPEGTVDPGFRLPVIDLPYTWRHTADGEYRVPDNVDVVAEPSAKFVASSSIVSNEQSYKGSLSQSVSVGASVQGGFGMFTAKASFSANSDYKRDTNELRKSQNSYMDTVGKATVYKARLCQTDRSSKMSLELETALHSLPSSSCSHDNERSLHGYMQIIREFGTHFTTSVVMGARAVQRKVIKKSTAQSYLRELRSQGFEAGVEVGIGPVSIGAHVSNKDSSSQESSSKQDQESTEIREFYVGGSAPEGSLEDGSTESLRTWARSAKENPAPIQYTLAGIDELLNGNAYFRTPMTWLIIKKRCMRLAIQKYCMEVVPDPSNCEVNAQVPSSRRRKRSADDKPHQYIKYGDFISLTSSSAGGETQVAVNQEADIVGGQGVCHVMKAEYRSKPNELNYFQILPEAGQPQLMGQNLTYGNKFRLSTIKGHNLLIVPHVGSTNIKQLLTDTQPDDIYKIQTEGRQLCVLPRTTSGRTYYMIWSNNKNSWTTSISFTLHGSTWTNVKQAVLSGNPYLIQELVNDAGNIKKISVKCDSCYKWLADSNLRSFNISIINVYTERLYTFANCKYRSVSTGKPRWLHCNRKGDAVKASALSIVQEQFTAYEAVLSFNSKHLDDHATPVDASEPGVIHLHSDSPRDVSFWGYEAPDVLAWVDSTVTVETVHIHDDPNCEDLDISEYEQDHRYITGSNTTVYNYILNSTNQSTSLTVSLKATARLPDFEVTYMNTNGKIRGAVSRLVEGRYRIRFGLAVKVSILNITYRGQYELQPGDVTLRHCAGDEEGTRYFYGEHMEWTLDLASISVEADPVVSLVHKRPVQFHEPDPPTRAHREVTVTFYSSSVICSNDDLEYREAFKTILENPEVLFENIKVSMIDTRDGRSEVTFAFDVIMYNDDRVDPLIEQMKQELNRQRDRLPCSTPFPYTAQRASQEEEKSFPAWAIAFAVLDVLLLTIFIVLVINVIYRYKIKRPTRHDPFPDKDFVMVQVALTLKRLHEAGPRYENLYVQRDQSNREPSQGEKAAKGRDLHIMQTTTDESRV